MNRVARPPLLRGRLKIAGQNEGLLCVCSDGFDESVGDQPVEGTFALLGI